MKQKLSHHLYMEFAFTSDYSKQCWQPRVRHFKCKDEVDSIYIGPVEIEVNVPDDFDPTGRQIAVLEKEKADALAAFQETVAKINKQLSELQAISA